MTHYICTGECGGVSDSPGHCTAESCSKKGQPLIACECKKHTSPSVTLNPYLNFPNESKDAMEFYHSILGGELTIQTYKDAGFPHDPKDDNKVIHANLMTEEGINIMASDGNDQYQIHMGDNVHLSLVGSDETQLTGYFNKLSEGGKVDMALARQFWGDIYGQLTDKFGVHWTVNISSEEKK